MCLSVWDWSLPHTHTLRWTQAPHLKSATLEPKIQFIVKCFIRCFSNLILDRVPGLLQGQCYWPNDLSHHSLNEGGKLQNKSFYPKSTSEASMWLACNDWFGVIWRCQITNMLQQNIEENPRLNPELSLALKGWLRSCVRATTFPNVIPNCSNPF